MSAIRQPWIDIWEPAGEWTRAIARHLPSRECICYRSDGAAWATLTPITFAAGARSVGGLSPISLVVSNSELCLDMCRLVELLRLQTDPALIMVVARPAAQPMAWRFRDAGAALIFDEYWQAATIARLIRRFWARRSIPHLSLEDKIWKNLPWQNLLGHDDKQEVQNVRTND